MFEKEEINEYIVKFTGEGSLEKALTNKEVILVVKGSVKRAEDSDNEDGTKNVIFKVGILEVKELETNED